SRDDAPIKGRRSNEGEEAAEKVSLNKNIGKQSGDLVDMPSKGVEQGMDGHVLDEIDGA
nr:hypothetical protein [Tanacetum cinerariifolium]